MEGKYYEKEDTNGVGDTGSNSVFYEFRFGRRESHQVEGSGIRARRDALS
jgi:hypothetical protein